ncbi:MAG: arginine--tRNA ligase [Candidatus Doudnabacteria bacterium CG10_big_fil_rev_8_21_14_0_10_41_10]|uniref:Arginine--tRNA ligase n=1 Tax=Candidatus Doudnabacteria bacterium CG10_big_fil_rev_8_21_14_0_10_41_10 TaxID=1974551 RepID=A0A2H0VF27_9BACT|nr:MAG: arginine--tRNA ligase [Candidatus Doudnabacteria bacterium CG10_big_fil_rev_8_21_14_0_10_41_10]
MKEEINKIILKTLKNLGYSEDMPFSVDFSSQEKYGDYSSNVAMVFGKSQTKNPFDLSREIAAEISTKYKNDFKKVEAVRPGFINFYFSENVLHIHLREVLKKKEKFGQSKVGKGEKVLVEYFQPNIAKPLHLGHMRTAIIGDALFKILKFVGYRVESESHMGDWGTQFGLLIAAYKKWGDEKVVSKNPIEELNKLYIKINGEIEKDPELKERGKQEFVKLEKGDKQNKKLWKQFVKWSMIEFEKAYKILKIRKADHNWPESFYENLMPKVLEKLKRRGMLAESQGAQIVDLSKYSLGTAIMIKSDGATTYLLRDLATYIYRKSKGFKKQIYVVDNRQKHTLSQTFKILELLGDIEDKAEAVHVDFGFLSLPEGAMSTRRGNVIGPEKLFEEAEKRVLKIIEEKNPRLKNKQAITKQVALGAIKYFDLSHNYKTDIVFDWEQVLNFEGNTGPYLQYTHARTKSLLRKVSGKPKIKLFILKQAEEQSLVRHMLKYSDMVVLSADKYQPNLIADYLYQLAGKFNNFYHKHRVIDEQDEKIKQSRLGLVTAVAQVLKNGLGLLGIEAPEEM